MNVKKIAFSSFVVMSFELMCAQSFTSGSLSYSIVGDAAHVAGVAPDYASAEISIPAEVEYNGNNYAVRGFVVSGNSFLSQNKNISRIDLPADFQLGASSFLGNEQLRSIRLPENMTVIQDSVFSQCVNLSDVVLPPRLTTIRENVFRRCLSLESIEFPASVTDIWRYSFSGTGLKGTVVFPAELNNVGIYAFAGSTLECADLSLVYHDFEVGKGGVTPDDVSTPPDDRNRLGSLMFSGCMNLREVKLPVNWNVIPRGFCENCENLVTINWPSSLLKIRMYAFQGCKNLEYAQIGENIQFILDGAFWGCNKLKSINGPVPENDPDFNPVRIPASLKEIRYKAFGETALYGDLHVPASVTRLGSEAFKGTYISSAIVETPSSYIYDNGYEELIGVGLFQDCKNLKSLSLPEGWRCIPANICNGCSVLSEISLPENWNMIGNNAFYNCALTTLVIAGARDGEEYPYDSQTIGENAFSGNPLTSITIAGSGPKLNFKGASIVPSDPAVVTEIVVQRATPPSVNINTYVEEDGKWIFKGLDNGPFGLPYNYMNEAVYHNPFYFKLEGAAEDNERSYRTAEYWKEFFQVILVNVEDINGDMPLIRTLKGGIQVEADGDMMVFDSRGLCVYSGSAGTIMLPSGIYIVQVSGITRKLAVR